MNIYVATSLDGFELCHPVEEEGFEKLHELINGESRAAGWKALAMEVIREDEGLKLCRSDSPWLGSHGLIFRRHAVEVLAPVLSRAGEFLPLASSEDVWLFNPTRLLDALDEDASTVVRLSSGRCVDIERYVFKGRVIGDSPAFKIPNLRVSPTYLSQEVVDCWNAAGLVGLSFKHVWHG